jgi:hypothetical protein
VSGWGWIVLMVVPAFVAGWIGKDYQNRADQCRAPDAPAPQPKWEPEDLLRPSRYTEEGNRYRRKALLLVFAFPIAWWALVLVVGSIVEQ